MTDNRIYLASRSPRRQELLRQIGVGFDELRLREAPGRDPDIVVHVMQPAVRAYYNLEELWQNVAATHRVKAAA